MDSPGGPVLTLLAPVNWTDRAPRLDPIPELGEHSVAILMGLGYSDDDVAALRSDGVI